MRRIMPHSLNTAVAVATIISSALVLLSNYRRKTNRAISFGILLVGVWIALRQLSSANPHEELWFRACVSIGPLILAQLIFCAETVSYDRLIPKQPILKIVLLTTSILAIIPWHNSFSKNTLYGFENGIGFYIYITINPICYIATCITLALRVGKLKGAAKTELKTIIHPSIFLGIAVCLLMAIRTITPIPIPKESSHILVAIFIFWLAYSFSTYKVFDAQYTFKIAARYSISAIFSTAFIFTLNIALLQAIPTETTAVLIGVLALIVNSVLPRNFGLSILSPRIRPSQKQNLRNHTISNRRTGAHSATRRDNQYMGESH